MPECKISIIIPVYNVSRYLRRCLESCVNQTMQEIEIIVVNDCSPDPRDSVIMREFEMKYPDKIKCLWHSENKKLGCARNTGIRAAKGEYLNFVDSDDYIDSRMCEKLYGKARENDADYVYCDLYMVDDAMRYRKRYTERDERCGRNLLCDVWVWGGIVKHESFVGNRLDFAEGFQYGVEDVSMCFTWLTLFEKCNKLPEALYYYCINPGSLMQSSSKDIRAPFYYDAFVQMRQRRKIVLSDGELLLFDARSLAWLATYLYFFPENACGRYFNSFMQYAHGENIDVPAVVASMQNDCIREKLGLLYEALHKPLTGEQIKRKLVDFDVMRAKNALKGFKRVVVWGSGIRGRRLCFTLKEAGISFEVTDPNKASGIEGLDVKPWDDLKDRADVVIATPMLGFYEIRAQVGNRIPTIDMEEIQA